MVERQQKTVSYKVEGKDAFIYMHECVGATRVHTYMHTKIKFLKERENQKNTKG